MSMTDAASQEAGQLGAVLSVSMVSTYQPDSGTMDSTSITPKRTQQNEHYKHLDNSPLLQDPNQHTYNSSNNDISAR